MTIEFDVSGTTAATSCSEARCQNGATCTSAGSQHALCICPRGYRGQHCENRVSACRQFGNWTAHFVALYFTVDSFEGSLAAWFCARGSRPEYGYSVCENRLSRPSWSSLALCRSVVTKTQRTWYRTKRDTYYSKYPRQNDHSESNDEQTDPYKSVEHWLTPVIIAFMASSLVFAPLVIYCSLICCCGYRAPPMLAPCFSFCECRKKKSTRTDKEEEMAMAEKYGTQLGELRQRSPKPENAVVVRELRQIQEQLEKDVDQLRTRRRQRDRKQRQTPKIFRIMSLYYYVSFWLCVFYLIISFTTNLLRGSFLFVVLMIIALVCVFLLPTVFLSESCSSSERHYLKNLGSVTSATDRIESIRNTQPIVCMHAQCWHYELRTRTVTYSDSNGNQHSRFETYHEPVFTAFIVEPFLFTHWLDNSQSTLTDVRKVGVTKIKMELTVQLGDRATAAHFVQEFQRFQEENRHRDVNVNFFVSKKVEGFEKRLAAYTDNSVKPCWISSLWFWLATAFFLGWPYRFAFNRAVGKTEYNVIKVIYTNNPRNRAAETDEDNTRLEPQREDDIIGDLQNNIQMILDRLDAGLSENDDSTSMPIKCAATDQHINVPLREAHHVREA